MTQTFSIKASNNRDDDDFQPLIPLISRKPYSLYEQTYQIKNTHIYISQEIGEPELYTDMIHTILMAGSGDTVYIHLNTPGGNLFTGVQLINAIQNSQAKIVTVLDGMCHSLGTLLFLSGTDLIVHDNSIMMFHTFSGGMLGKGHEITSQLDATVKWFSELAKQIYIPFLNTEEFNRILKGEDLWMRSAEIRKRLMSMSKDIKQPKPEPKPKRPKPE